MSTRWDRQSCSIVVEVGQAHEGSENLAHAFIEEAAKSGADAIKFQLHFAEDESSSLEDFRSRGRYGRETRFEYWARHEFSREVVEDLIEHSRELGLLVGFSTFSLRGLDELSELEFDFLKVGSAEAVQKWFLRRARESELPVVLSTGMSKIEEIEDAIEILGKGDKDLILLQCASSYPSALEQIGLNLIPDFAERFGIPVGLSDHSGKLVSPLAAIARGAAMVEVHGTFSKLSQGPDATSSLDFAEISFLCDFRDQLRVIDSNPVDKDTLSSNFEDMRTTFGRSLATKVEIEPGQTIRTEELYFAKPGGGIPPEFFESAVTLSPKNRIPAGSILQFQDFEGF